MRRLLGLAASLENATWYVVGAGTKPAGSMSDRSSPMTTHVADRNFVTWSHTDRNAIAALILLMAAIALPFAVVVALTFS
jgi:hypothetical protein